MNKKIFIFILFSLSFLLTGCYNREKLNYDYPEQIKIQKNYINENMGCYDYGEGPQQYEILFITDEQQIKDIIDNLNDIEYTRPKTVYEFCDGKYQITFDDVEIIVFKYDYFNRYEVKKGSFTFLDDYHFEEITEE